MSFFQLIVPTLIRRAGPFDLPHFMPTSYCSLSVLLAIALLSYLLGYLCAYSWPDALYRINPRRTPRK